MIALPREARLPKQLPPRNDYPVYKKERLRKMLQTLRRFRPYPYIGVSWHVPCFLSEVGENV